MKNLIWLTTIVFLISCASIDETKQPPVLSEDDSSKELIIASLEFGGRTLIEAKKILSKRDATPLLKNILANAESSLTEIQVIRLFNIYQSLVKSVELKTVASLLKSNRQHVRKLGWNLVYRFPSRQMAGIAEGTLTKALESNSESDHFIPEMAKAVRINGVDSVYTLIRHALMETDHDEFAKTMASINPKKASQDFLDYLAKADLEELRQLSQKSINTYAALVALRHMLIHHIPTNHPKLPIIFAYSVSRNLALSELANSVLQPLISQDQDNLARMLIRLPTWVQIAFIENVRRTSNPIGLRLIATLKNISPDNNIRREAAEVSK